MVNCELIVADDTSASHEPGPGNLGLLVLGRSGNDLLVGGPASDHVEGEGGEDTLRGGAGRTCSSGARGTTASSATAAQTSSRADADATCSTVAPATTASTAAWMPTGSPEAVGATASSRSTVSATPSTADPAATSRSSTAGTASAVVRRFAAVSLDGTRRASYSRPRQDRSKAGGRPGGSHLGRQQDVAGKKVPQRGAEAVTPGHFSFYMMSGIARAVNTMPTTTMTNADTAGAAARTREALPWRRHLALRPRA